MLPPARLSRRDVVQFMVVFVLVAAALNVPLSRYLPAPVTKVFPEKLALFEDMRHAVDTIFVGSSLYYRQIDPTVVDVSVAGRGLRSFNLGAVALTFAEQLALVDYLQHVAVPGSLRYVVVEPILNANIEYGNLATERVLRFHTAAGTWEQIDYAAHLPSKVTRKARFIGLHLLAFGYDFFNFGKCADLMTPPTLDGGLLPPEKRGFLSLGDGAAQDPSDPGRQYLAPGEFERLLATAERYEPIGSPLTSHQIAVLQRLIDRIRALGAQPVFLITPRLDWDVDKGATILNHVSLNAFRRTHERVFGSVPLLHYYEPSRYPELYRPELWYDSHHLNGTGAARFSRRLGQDLDAALPPLKDPDAAR